MSAKNVKVGTSVKKLGAWSEPLIPKIIKKHKKVEQKVEQQDVIGRKGIAWVRMYGETVMESFIRTKRETQEKIKALEEETVKLITQTMHIQNLYDSMMNMPSQTIINMEKLSGNK